MRQGSAGGIPFASPAGGLSCIAKSRDCFLIEEVQASRAIVPGNKVG